MRPVLSFRVRFICYVHCIAFESLWWWVYTVTCTMYMWRYSNGIVALQWHYKHTYQAEGYMYFRVVITGFTKPNTDVRLLGVCFVEWLAFSRYRKGCGSGTSISLEHRLSFTYAKLTRWLQLLSLIKVNLQHWFGRSTEIKLELEWDCWVLNGDWWARRVALIITFHLREICFQYQRRETGYYSNKMPRIDNEPYKLWWILKSEILEINCAWNRGLWAFNRKSNTFIMFTMDS